jgi:tRNA (guanine-N7-)-methyltransferase
MLTTLRACGALANAYGDFAPRPAHRPRTKFERQAVDAGRAVYDIVFHRIGSAHVVG